ncbi:MAG: hypothetical protein M3P28_08705 [Thermoproteota archaeon]|nr:hypothetical protein [Thermoproteota archaeon]
MNKPTITKIEFTKEILDEIDKKKNGEPVPKTKIITYKDGRSYEYTTNKRFSYEVARKRLVELYKGLCTSCGDYPAYSLSYDVGDSIQPAKLIERYCEPRFRKWENRR